MNILSKAWSRWKIIGSVVGDAQGRVIAVVFYYTIMAPFGLGVSLFSDPLRVKKSTGSSSAWVEREQVSSQLEDVRRQF